jgi:hypothetical protein
MTMPIEIKLAVERMALELEVTVVGVHSVCLVDGDVDVIFDVEPDLSGNGWHLVFPLR